MKVLKDLISKSHDTLEEVEWYAEKAHTLHPTHKKLADVYIHVSEMHVDIYRQLHEQMMSLITTEKEKGTEIPAVMSAIWDYEHEKLIKELAEAKSLIDEYKKLH